MPRHSMKIKALALTIAIPAVLVVGGCKSGTPAYSGPTPAVTAAASADPNANINSVPN